MIKRSFKIYSSAILLLSLAACSTNGDSFGYTAPPTNNDMYSNEAGNLTQPGGVIAEVDAEQASPNDSFVTLRE
jgi:hypothetical protein